jgi:predicted DNA-binding transcriptional regulator YafY
MEGYRLPPVMFTMDEATAFLTAEKLVEKLTDTSTDESFKSAMYKIKAVLRSTEKDYLETMDNHIEVLHNPYTSKEKNVNNSLQPILKSISEKKVISIVYFANHTQENTSRNVESVGIFYSGSHWHLLAFCQLRNDYRDFRIDRIQQITSTPLPYKKEHPSLKSFLKQVAQDKELHKIVILVNKEIIKHFGEQKYYNGFVSQREVKSKIEMTFLCCAIEGFARWYMMFGDNAEIISPDSLKNVVKHIASKTVKKL